ncbi:hypothetical protein QZH56_36890 (plasmid) [Streptomyces olivoreticuli]|uniref:hypothetical protein n=1 Tax=Streptomyces olivoreticuli TaxID=68246 RepID=UPI00265B42B5|nr:hypothetical protein [Streptomyces olivoreticuli]WKK27831.1 hypothetical protein QZH56_36890 [Streptomyces olivoreticuli]
MDRNAELAALARQAAGTAGVLRLLVERMNDVGWHLDEYSDEDLRTVAAALKGTAIMMAMDTGNAELLSELTGRTVHEIDPTEWLRKLRGDDEEP